MNAQENNPFRFCANSRAARRIQRGLKSIKTGLGFVDDATLGVTLGDLFIIAGGTGFGKTELATAIAQEASRQTEVHFLALESEEGEIQDRLLYKRVIQKLKEKGRYYSFPEFRQAKIDVEYPEIIAQAEKELAQESENLEITTPRNISADLLTSLIEPSSPHGLIICDHLHYLELEGRSEHEGISDAMKKIRDATLFADKPMILLSHLRKPDRFTNEVPTYHDLHGSSEITKRATAVIIISRSKAIDPDSEISLTTIQIAKYRHDQSIVKYFAQARFNLRTRSYEKDYFLALKNQKGELEMIQSKANIPYWAKHAKPYPTSIEIETEIKI